MANKAQSKPAKKSPKNLKPRASGNVKGGYKYIPYDS